MLLMSEGFVLGFVVFSEGYAFLFSILFHVP